LQLAATPALARSAGPAVDLVVLETTGETGRLAETMAALAALAPNARIALLDYRESLAQPSLAMDATAAAVLPKPLFSFELPQRLANLLALAPAPAAATPVRQLEENLAAQMPLRILLVDDNWINLRVGSGMLARYGYEAVMARDGLQALEQISLNQFDLVLLDVQMPHMDGYEVARQVTARFPENRRPLMIAVTASAMQGDRERCLESGMCDFLAKPFKAAELQTMLIKWYPVVVKHRADADAGTGHAPALLQTPAPNTMPAIDFDRLLEISEGKPESMMGMVKLFEEQAAYLIEQMEAAWTERLPDQLSALAHKLKGSAGTCGINVLATPLAAVEAAAREGNLEEAGRQLAHVRTGLTVAHKLVGEHFKINGTQQIPEVTSKQG
jgi:CheY-like chemotaxis protein